MSAQQRLTDDRRPDPRPACKETTPNYRTVAADDTDARHCRTCFDGESYVTECANCWGLIKA